MARIMGRTKSRVPPSRLTCWARGLFLTFILGFTREIKQMVAIYLNFGDGAADFQSFDDYRVEGFNSVTLFFFFGEDDLLAFQHI